MLRAAVAAVFLASFAMFTGGAGPPSAAEEGQCPPGTLPFPQPAGCAQVVARAGLPGQGQPYPADRAAAFAGAGSSMVPDPNPGSMLVGVFYRPGYLDGSEGSELYTGMMVYPGGVGDLGTTTLPDGAHDNVILMPAKNRTAYSMELLTLYAGDSASGSFLIYDWSCVPEFPCLDQNTGEWHTGPHYVDSDQLRDMPCYVDKMTNPLGTNGDWHHTLYYRNRTERVDQGSPPMWRNSALLANYCTYTWDTVYSHDYRAPAANCAVDTSAGYCWHGWGPVIETTPDWPDWQPDSTAISKAGFIASTLTLFKPGEPSGLLSPAYTEWRDELPGWDPVAHLTPNHSWGKGTYLDSDADGAWDWADPDDDDDGATDVNEAGAPLCADARSDDGFDDVLINDGCPAVGQSEAAAQCINAADDDGDAVINDGCPGAGLWAEGQFKIGTNPLGTCSYGGLGYPNRNWPADVSGNIAVNKVNIADVSAYFGVPKIYGASPGDPAYDQRFDVIPGPGQVPGAWINISDLQYITTATAPMLGGAKMFGGPPCPW